jgi:hypothetical protein
MVNWSPGMTIETAEKECILQAFRFYRGNKTQTAQSLGINIRTLERKMEQYESDDLVSEKRKAADTFQREKDLARMRGLPEPQAPSVAATRSKAVNGETNEESAESIHGSGTGLHVESTSEDSAEHAMSMLERKKVQEVLPRHATQGGKHARR